LAAVIDLIIRDGSNLHGRRGPYLVLLHGPNGPAAVDDHHWLVLAHVGEEAARAARVPRPGFWARARTPRPLARTRRRAARAPPPSGRSRRSPPRRPGPAPGRPPG